MAYEHARHLLSEDYLMEVFATKISHNLINIFSRDALNRMAGRMSDTPDLKDVVRECMMEERYSVFCQNPCRQVV